LDSFSQMTQDWAGFFSALAQVSGGLVGLVFVALTFKPKDLGTGGDPMLGALARQTFSDFLLLLMVSLIMLVPRATAANLGLVLLGIGVVGSGRILAVLVGLRRHLRGSSGGWAITQRFMLSAVAHVTLAGAGAALLAAKASPDLSYSLLLSGVLLLLLSGSRSAWLLVLHEAK
jgi:hypothetical protein